MPVLTHAHIELNPVGVPIVSGTTMKVIELIRFHLHQNWDARQLHEQFPHLTLGAIYSALSYFHDNEAEIRAEIDQRDKASKDIRDKWEDSPAQRRLRERKRG